MDKLNLEFFGNRSQIKLQQRYYRLWPYLKAHPRLSFVGRAIGIDEPRLHEVDELAGLTTELGFLAMTFTGSSIVDALRTALEERGLKTGLWQHLLSNEETKSRCHAVVTSRRLPIGYQIKRISSETQTGQLQSVQELMERVGVAPLPGYILRNSSVPTVAEMILDQQDMVVANGVGIMRHNPQGPYGKAAHVGFLATDPSHRGQGLAQTLLARIMLACYDEYGADLMHTGVRAGNMPSQRVCHNCGLVDSGKFFLGATYPQVVEQFTR